MMFLIFKSWTLVIIFCLLYFWYQDSKRKRRINQEKQNATDYIFYCICEGMGIFGMVAIAYELIVKM